jgi:hypothetical protein
MQSLASTNPHWARVVHYSPFSLCVIHKKGLCPTSGDTNRLMMMMMTHDHLRVRSTALHAIHFSSFSYPYPTKWGWYNMFFISCDKDSAIIFTTDRLPDGNPPWKRLMTANAAGTNGLPCFPKHGGAQDNIFWSAIL